MDVRAQGRHGVEGYHALHDFPRSPSVEQLAMSTGWPALDTILKIYPGQFLMTTGLAGHGKTTLLFNLIINLAREHGLRAFLYVPENETYVYDKLKRIHGGLQHEFDIFAQHHCFIQSSAYSNFNSDAHTHGWVLDRAQVAVEQDECAIVMVDPWNELERAKGKDQLMTDYIGQCLMDMKRFCKMMDVCFMMVAHPTKAAPADGRMPTLYDIEGSANWVNKCDNGIIVHRDIAQNTTKVVSAKVREIGAGRVGECKFHVDEKTERFTPLHLTGETP